MIGAVREQGAADCWEELKLAHAIEGTRSIERY
jgi:hypothetical protein